MNVLDVLLSAQGGGAVKQLSQSAGLSEQQTAAVLQQVVPAMARGLQRNAASGDGLGALLGALSGGGHQRYLENPAEVTSASGVREGESILGHVFGTRDVSRNVAGRAARETGVSTDVIKQLLPMIAPLVMAALSKRAGEQGALPESPARADSSVLGTLNSILDADRDGSALDDVINLAQKFF